MSSQQRFAGDLVPVHGGRAELVDRVVPLKDRKRFLEEAARLPSLRVTRADLSTVHRLADGALSPLEGPMKEAVYHGVLDAAQIRGADGKAYAWTIPLAFPAADEEARELGRGASAAVRDEAGDVVAILDDVEVFAWDKPKYVRSVYGTDRTDHPGARIATDDPRTKLVGGTIRALPSACTPSTASTCSRRA